MPAGVLGISVGVLGISVGDLGISVGDLGISAGDLGISAGDLGISAGDLGISAGDLGISVGDLGISAGDLGISVGDLGISAGVLGISVGVLGISIGDLGISVGVLGISIGVLGISVEVLGISIGDLGISVGVLGISIGVIGISIGVIGISVGVLGMSVGDLGISIGVLGMSGGVLGISSGVDKLGVESRTCFQATPSKCLRATRARARSSASSAPHGQEAAGESGLRARARAASSVPKGRRTLAPGFTPGNPARPRTRAPAGATEAVGNHLPSFPVPLPGVNFVGRWFVSGEAGGEGLEVRPQGGGVRGACPAVDARRPHAGAACLRSPFSSGVNKRPGRGWKLGREIRGGSARARRCRFHQRCSSGRGIARLGRGR
ncbi:hypothetical protein Hsar01_01984 [Haloferula sargassicola]|uniref:Uncharacterized protein n=1 Tax=Haloferula sargassicola TaxID=490096 RepID=A0ABP9UME2_9BACT